LYIDREADYMMVAGLIALFSIIVLIDITALRPAGSNTKAVMLYIIILTSGFVISLLMALDRAPVSPTVIIEKAVRMIIPGG
jgi:hypothetical protein